MVAPKATAPTVRLTREEKLRQSERALAMARAEISYAQQLIAALRVELLRTPDAEAAS